jgi:hypothetical protein
MLRFWSIALAAIAVAWSALLVVVVFYAQVISDPTTPTAVNAGWAWMPFISVPLVLASLSLAATWWQWHQAAVVGTSAILLLLYSFLLIFSYGLLIFICVPLLAGSLGIAMATSRPRKPQPNPA